MINDKNINKYKLGLDVGSASVGAALLTDNEIIAMHVRTFDRAETAKEGKSLNLIRRESRLTRRKNNRRHHRLAMFRRYFHRLGAIEQPTTDAFMTHESPWELRALGLDQLLNNKQWVRVLYHILKHRGFQSNRKSELKSDEKAGQMLSGISLNQSRLETSGMRTIGELFAKSPDYKDAKRNKRGNYSHTVVRSDLVDELVQLFAAQRALGNVFAKEVVEEKVMELILNRWPALAGDDLLAMVGKCTFEDHEYRAPKASYSAERFLWLIKLNNLRLYHNGETHQLTDQQRALVLDLPFIKAKLTYKQLRKLLNLPSDHTFNGLRYPVGDKPGKDPETATLFEATAFHSLRKAYTAHGLQLEWSRDQANKARLDQIAYALSVFKDDKESTAWLLAQGIEKAVIEAVLNVSFSQFIKLSIKALLNIIPFMEVGQRYDTAVVSAGYGHHSHHPNVTKQKYLPRFDNELFTNPVVARAVNQARKLVNAIIKEYGSPEAIHIELARDLNRSYEERRKIERDQANYQEAKAQDIEKFKQIFGTTPKGKDLIKWRLYREQNGQCAYSQQPLAPYGEVDKIFSPGQVEIDHALPYSRSFNNSMSNRVLVLTRENRDKANNTPYEYLDGESNSLRWQRFVASVTANKNYRQGKKNNLLRKQFDAAAAAEFRERHLNDTRYIGKAFKDWIDKYLLLSETSKHQSTIVVSGELTAFLRARWGLIKNRQDGDLHHALDAAVVAACSRSMVKRLADYARKGELRGTSKYALDPETGAEVDMRALRKIESAFPMPWPHFRDELIAKLSADPMAAIQSRTNLKHLADKNMQPIRVSRAPTRRNLGAAHQETIRSAKYMDQLQSSLKVPLSKLKLKDLPNLVGYDDPRNASLINAIRERLNQYADNGVEAFAEPLYRPSKRGQQAPMVKTVKLLTVQKSGLRVRGGIANNGNIMRTDIFTDGKKFFLVPIYVADTVADQLPTKAITKRKTESEWPIMGQEHQFLFSLYANDWVCIQTKESSPFIAGYYAGVDRSNGSISLWTHDRNQAIGKKGLLRGIGVKNAKVFQKYHVDMLGNLHPAPVGPRQHLRRKG